MELNFKDEEKLIELLKSINYRFKIIVNKDYSGIEIIDYSSDIDRKIDEYDGLKDELREANAIIEELEYRISELEDKLSELE